MQRDSLVINLVVQRRRQRAIVPLLGGFPTVAAVVARIEVAAVRSTTALLPFQEEV